MEKENQVENKYWVEKKVKLNGMANQAKKKCSQTGGILPAKKKRIDGKEGEEDRAKNISYLRLEYASCMHKIAAHPAYRNKMELRYIRQTAGEAGRRLASYLYSVFFLL